MILGLILGFVAGVLVAVLVPKFFAWVKSKEAVVAAKL